MREILDKLTAIVGAGNVLQEANMSQYTTFKVGGPAQVLVKVLNTDMLSKVWNLLQQCETGIFIIGNGSNLLVSDEGYRGVVIKLEGEFANVTADGERIVAGAGAKLSDVCKAAFEQGLGGIEFAYGIPGTVGGAMVMNAGAYGGEMKDVVETVTVMDKSGQISTLSNEEMKFGYRTGILKYTDYIAIQTTFRLSKADQNEIAAKMEDFIHRRMDKQPLEFPSAGSTFKRPSGNFAGKLIQDANLAGFRVGGACVSPKHCGFIVNDKGATASDIEHLMEIVVERVKEMSGVTLEPEVIKVGDPKCDL